MKNKPNPPTIILLGNSYANQLYPGLVSNPRLKSQVILSIGDCGFIFNENDKKLPFCPKQRVFLDNLITNNKSIKYAFIDGLELKPDGNYIKEFKKRITNLESKGIKVVVFIPHLRPSFNIKSCYKAPFRNKVRECSFSVNTRKQLNVNFEPLINSIRRTNPDTLFFDQNNFFCKKNKCSYVYDGIPFFRDKSHLSEFGSNSIQPSFTSWLKTEIPEILD